MRHGEAFFACRYCSVSCLEDKRPAGLLVHDAPGLPAVLSSSKRRILSSDWVRKMDPTSLPTCFGIWWRSHSMLAGFMAGHVLVSGNCNSLVSQIAMWRSLDPCLSWHISRINPTPELIGQPETGVTGAKRPIWTRFWWSSMWSLIFESFDGTCRFTLRIWRVNTGEIQLLIPATDGAFAPWQRSSVLAWMHQKNPAMTPKLVHATTVRSPWSAVKSIPQYLFSAGVQLPVALWVCSPQW